MSNVTYTLSLTWIMGQKILKHKSWLSTATILLFCMSWRLLSVKTKMVASRETSWLKRTIRRFYSNIYTTVYTNSMHTLHFIAWKFSRERYNNTYFQILPSAYDTRRATSHESKHYDQQWLVLSSVVKWSLWPESCINNHQLKSCKL